MTSIKTYQFRKLYTTNCSYGDREARPFEVRLDPGSYKIELWGSSGGCDTGGNGSYARATIVVKYPTTYYLFIGSKGTCSNTESRTGGCNGGGNSHAGSEKNNYAGSGGGSTDFRTSINVDSRILVAAGGGGGRVDSSYNAKGGDGGSDVGYDGQGWRSNVFGRGATQKEGGIGAVYGSCKGGNGTLLYGGNGIGKGASGGGGGGGYYGGGGSYENGGGGGSSFISADLVGFLKSGREIFSSPLSGNEKGHNGDGFARITLIGNPISCKFQRRNPLSNSIFMMISFYLS